MMIGIIRVLSDVMNPTHCFFMEARDNIENFVFVTEIRSQTEGKYESTGDHEIWKFGDTFREFKG